METTNSTTTETNEQPSQYMKGMENTFSRVLFSCYETFSEDILLNLYDTRDDRNDVDERLKREEKLNNSKRDADKNNKGQSATLFVRLKNAEQKVFDDSNKGIYQDIKTRMEKIRHTVDSVVDSSNKVFSTVTLEMTEIEKSIDKLSLRIEEVQQIVFDEVKAKAIAGNLTYKLKSLEEELGLTQNDKPLHTRLSNVEENIAMRISELECQTLEQKSKNKSNESLTDRLNQLEEGLGLKLNSFGLFQRILSLETCAQENTLRTVQFEKVMYGDDNARNLYASLHERLKRLERSLDLESKSSSIISRISRIENSPTLRVASLEYEAYTYFDSNKKNESLPDRLESVRKELGLEGDETSDLSKIAYLERGVKDMKACMDEFDHKITAENACNEGLMCPVGEALCIRVLRVERELGLERDGRSISERISIIGRSFNERIGKLEDALYRKGYSSTARMTRTDRLIRLDIELGVDKNQGNMYSRILTLTKSINKMKKHFSVFEIKVFHRTQGHKAEEESLHDRLIRLGQELDLELTGNTFIFKVLNLKQALSPSNKDEIKDEDVSCVGVGAEMLELEELIRKKYIRRPDWHMVGL